LFNSLQQQTLSLDLSAKVLLADPAAELRDVSKLKSKNYFICHRIVYYWITSRISIPGIRI